MPIPLLILSDAPTSGTGLGRICRDLAVRIHANLSDVYRVGTLGCFGSYSRALTFPQYDIQMSDWVIGNLPEVWSDFAGEEKGIILTIWDSSRLLWFSRPNNCADPRLKKFLQAGLFERWGYVPIDATGVNDKLTGIIKYTMEGFDRILAYSKWAEDIVHRTLGPRLDIESLPHGIDTSVFFPRPRVQARHSFGQKLGAKWVRGKKNGQFMSIPDDVFLVGIVATNQIRKDWGLGFATFAEIVKQRRAMLWIKIDVQERHWSIPALVTDYGVAENVIVTIKDYTDEEMAWAYSACDVTLGIGLGEGYGYPIFESLACGTPCIHGNYGGAPEHMDVSMRIAQIADRLEGPYNCRRMVYDPQEWTDAALHLMGSRSGKPLLPAHLDWNNLWPRWEQWLRAGVK
jgi:glycosyltransferase involved in cell wall biosynthesis